MAEPCPCGSGKDYSKCCEPFLKKDTHAETAEALMRSRYTAFAKNEISYLRDTLDRRKRSGFDPAEVRKWNADVEWQSLRILVTEQGQPADTAGVVEFSASYTKAGTAEILHERSRFKKKELRWYYIDGQHIGDDEQIEPASNAPVKAAPKIGRNAPCPCGSGKKFKRCCGR